MLKIDPGVSVRREVFLAERARTIQGTLGVVEEDFGVCVAMQKNYASGAASPGPLSARHEMGVAYFRKMIGEVPGL